MDLLKHVKTNNAARSGSQGSLRELNFTWAVVAVKTGNDEHFVGTLFQVWATTRLVLRNMTIKTGSGNKYKTGSGNNTRQGVGISTIQGVGISTRQGVGISTRQGVGISTNDSSYIHMFSETNPRFIRSTCTVVSITSPG